MTTQIATRVPPLLSAQMVPNHLQMLDLPFGMLGINGTHKRKPGRQPKQSSADIAAATLANDMNFMMIGRAFLSGSLQLLARLLVETGYAHVDETRRRATRGKAIRHTRANKRGRRRRLATAKTD